MLNQYEPIIQFILSNESLKAFADHKPQIVNDLEIIALMTFKEIIALFDSELKLHSINVSRYAFKIAKAIGLDYPAKHDIAVAGLLHDIGKISIGKDLLNKKGALSFLEYDMVKKHSTRGADLVQKILPNKAIYELVRHHHERYDGTGYPGGLKGEQIPLGARIICVADAYDAMNSTRPYRRKLDEEEALRQIRNNSGTQFDPRVVEIFVRVFSELMHLA